MKESNSQAFRRGFRDGIPIGLGYLAVSFSIGIAARNIGLNAFQGFLMSLLNNASAGEYAGLTVIAANSPYIEVAIVTLITNARYLLMSCAMSQRLSPDLSLGHRLLMSYDITDELFGIAISRPGTLNPYYTYGAMVTPLPGWAFGTMLGVIAGNIMSPRIVSAFSVALFGMFIAIIIPPSKQNKVVAGLVTLAFISSFAATCLPWISTLSDGTRTIILTVVLSAGAAFFFPVPTEDETSASTKQ